MSFYPVNLDLRNKRCAVVGGGKVALRKIRSLLQAGALVTVISPSLDEDLLVVYHEQQFTYFDKVYENGDLQGFFLVICASSDHDANKRAAQEAKEQGALVNVSDNSFPSDFTLPAKVERGPLLLTISTGGLSPAFSVLVKKELEEKYDDNYVAFLQIVAELRAQLVGKVSTSKQRELLWRELLTKDILQLVQKGNLSEAKVKLEDAVSRFRSES